MINKNIKWVCITTVIIVCGFVLYWILNSWYIGFLLNKGWRIYNPRICPEVKTWHRPYKESKDTIECSSYPYIIPSKLENKGFCEKIIKVNKHSMDGGFHKQVQN